MEASFLNSPPLSVGLNEFSSVACGRIPMKPFLSLFIFSTLLREYAATSRSWAYAAEAADRADFKFFTSSIIFYLMEAGLKFLFCGPSDGPDIMLSGS